MNQERSEAEQRQFRRMTETPVPRLVSALAAGDLGGAARRMYNVFEDALPPRRAAEIQRLKTELIQQGALGASMSGTGSAVFGLFDSEGAARRAKTALSQLCPTCFLARTTGKLV